MTHAPEDLLEPTRFPSRPTQVPPGPDRVEVYANRYDHGERIFHPRDLKHEVPRGIFHVPQFEASEEDI